MSSSERGALLVCSAAVDTTVSCEMDRDMAHTDVEGSSDISQETVDHGNESDNSQDIGQNETSDTETEPGAVGEGVQGILCLAVVAGDGDLASGERLLSLRPAKLANCDTGRDRHHRRCNQVDGGHAEADVCRQDGPGDGGESGSHGLR